MVLTGLILISHDEGLIGDFNAAVLGANENAPVILTDAAQATDLLTEPEYAIVFYDTRLVDMSEMKRLSQTWPKDTLLVPLLDINAQKSELSASSYGFHLDIPLKKEQLLASVKRLWDIQAGRSGNPRKPLSELITDEFDAFVKARFWKDVILGIISGSEESISFMAEGIQLPESAYYVLPIIADVKDWQRNMTVREKILAGSLIKSKAEECFLGDNGSGIAFQINDDTIIVLCYGRHDSFGISRTAGKCLPFISACEELFSITMTCCVGSVAGLSELSGMMQELIEKSRQNFAFKKVIYLWSGKEINANALPLPDMRGWYYLLTDGKFDPFLISITEYLTKAMAENKLNSDILNRLSQDFLQLIHVVLQEKGIAAHSVFGSEKSSELWKNANISVPKLLMWVFWAVGELARYMEQTTRGQTAVEAAVEYIRQNLSVEISRVDIAEYVHLSQNHLARIFKKEMSMSISDFILHERMKSAIELLIYTAIPVGEVAERVGYQNYSYFYTLFRKLTGMNPSSYREINSRAKDETA